MSSDKTMAFGVQDHVYTVGHYPKTESLRASSVISVAVLFIKTDRGVGFNSAVDC